MTTIGALAGLVIAIVLIILKIPAVYSLIFGALFGGVLGCISLSDTILILIDGVKDMSPAVLRILTAGVLFGVLVKTGAAEVISKTIIKKFGKKYVYFALAFSTMILCSMGVFVDVAIVTVAPVALLIGRQLSIHPSKLLIVMIGGGKCGNVISPNPNTIIAAENFNADLYAVMFVNVIPAIVGLIATVFLIARIFPNEPVDDNRYVVDETIIDNEQNKPSFIASIIGPVVTIILLALRPVAGIAIDPLLALPIGGLVGLICMRKFTMFNESIGYGLSKMSTIAILLIGTGAIAGIMKNSDLKEYILSGLALLSSGEYFIAPVAGALMSMATASTTAGATIASSSFANTIIALGIPGVWGAAMINSGATVLDHLPHGSFFHATGGALGINFKQRMKLIPYETLIGSILAFSTVATYFINATFL
jgi:GntP family gluconate:H+ symporter